MRRILVLSRGVFHVLSYHTCKTYNIPISDRGIYVAQSGFSSMPAEKSVGKSPSIMSFRSFRSSCVTLTVMGSLNPTHPPNLDPGP